MSVQHKLQRVINASGRMSILGVSILSDQIVHAIKTGGQNYFVMEDLHREAGKFVASFVNTEAAFVVNSASAGIALATAGVITQGQPFKERELQNHRVTMPRELLLMKGHNVNYGAPVSTMIELGGGEVKEIGYANGCTIHDIKASVSDQTVGIFFIKSHHCVQKDMPSLEDVQALAKKLNLPLILDVAAEEDLKAYGDKADIIIFSGSKALEGPTAGILAGKEQYVNYAKRHQNGIGRAMKVGKEAIFGLLQALKDYNKEGLSKEEQLDRLQVINDLNELPGVNVQTHQDEAGRNIFRARIAVNPEKAKLSALQLLEQLKQGDIAIFTRDYHANNGFFDIDPRPLIDGDAHIIVKRIKEILGG